MKYLVSFLFVVLVGVGTYFFAGYQSLGNAVGDPNFKENFVVEKGSGFHRVLDQLSDKGLLKKDLFMKVYARVTKYNTKLKAGTYPLRGTMTQAEILSELTTGKSLDIKVTFQEGLNIHDMGALLERKGLFKYDQFLQVVRDKVFVKQVLGEGLPSFEGYLFPETYFISKTMTIKDLVLRMVDNFQKNYEKSLVGAKLKLDKKTHVVLASMIEKETGVPEERNLISSVFHNRIRLKMRLQSDPTILYGIFDRTGVYPTNIRKKDILEKTRYNTYSVRGLPYGPIANPGYASLKAAVNPVVSKKLYFVSRNDGTHVFSQTLDQHNAAVRKFQMDPKARKGKSWRDRTK